MLRYFFYILVLMPLGIVAQTVTGRVVDAKNKPLSGASVIWLNNKKGITAKEDGSFSIKKTATDNM
ncbi:MAG: carboxypeptidase-like regulatory domain-containing protein, partial [Ferruginibacter sp.]